MVFTRGIFREILLAADQLYEKMGKSNKERDGLMAQMCTYRKRLPPFDISFHTNESPQIWWSSIEDYFPKGEDYICQLAMKLFAIIPNAAGCERIWSRLGWYYGKRRTCLSLDKLENMQKLSAFYLSNMKKELPYYSIGKSVAELKEIIRDAEIFEDEELLEEDFEDKDNTFEEEEILEIEKIINLDAEVIVKDLGKIIDEEVRELEGGIMPINIEDNNNGNNEINEYEGWNNEEAANKYINE